MPKKILNRLSIISFSIIYPLVGLSNQNQITSAKDLINKFNRVNIIRAVESIPIVISFYIDETSFTNAGELFEKWEKPLENAANSWERASKGIIKFKYCGDKKFINLSLVKTKEGESSPEPRPNFIIFKEEFSPTVDLPPSKDKIMQYSRIFKDEIASVSVTLYIDLQSETAYIRSAVMSFFRDYATGVTEKNQESTDFNVTEDIKWVNFNPEKDAIEYHTFDIQSVACHEFGHFLGLKDLLERNKTYDIKRCVMYYGLNYCDIRKSLTKIDKEILLNQKYKEVYEEYVRLEKKY